MTEPRTPPDPRDDIAILLRIAGRRPAVPDDRTVRVRAAARAQWEQEVRLRKRRRNVWTAAALLAAAAVVMLIAPGILRRALEPPPAPVIIAEVESLAGAAEVTGGVDDQAGRFLRTGDSLETGAGVVTAQTARLALRLGSGHSLRLDTGTRIRLLGPRAVALEGGAIYLDSGMPGGRAEPVAIRTPLGTIREIGTQFEVRLLNDSVRVRVREGLVVLHGDGRNQQVAAASELTLDDKGVVTTRSIPIWGEAWEWTAAVSRVPDLRGMTAGAFLEWVSREKGWRLSFSGEDTARAAATIVLDGSIERMSIDDALQAVLPTCGLAARASDGALLVEPADGRAPAR